MMGTISISCNVSLSNKLRKILSNGNGKLSLLVPNIENGKGVGHLSLTSDDIDISTDAALALGETSIQFIVTSAAQELPGNIGHSTAAIFSTVPPKGSGEALVNKLAATSAPEQSEISTAIGEVKTPSDFSEVNDSACKEYIQDLDGLLAAVSVARSTKRSDIDPSQAINDREKAMLFEEREKEEAIDALAYIVNVKAAKIIINDLDINLSLNMPYDLSNISARRIAASKDLIGLIKEGFVEFISPTEVESYVNKAVHGLESIGDGLEVYDSPEAAESAIASSQIDMGETLEITAADEAPTEEETMVMDLTAGRPPSSPSSPDGTTVTSHGSTPTPTSTRVPETPSGEVNHTLTRRVG